MHLLDKLALVLKGLQIEGGRDRESFLLSCSSLNLSGVSFPSGRDPC